MSGQFIWPWGRGYVANNNNRNSSEAHTNMHLWFSKKGRQDSWFIAGIKLYSRIKIFIYFTV